MTQYDKPRRNIFFFSDPWPRMAPHILPKRFATELSNSWKVSNEGATLWQFHIADIAIENVPIEIVSFPIKHGDVQPVTVDFPIKHGEFQRISPYFTTWRVDPAGCPCRRVKQPLFSTRAVERQAVESAVIFRSTKKRGEINPRFEHS